MAEHELDLAKEGDVRLAARDAAAIGAFIERYRHVRSCPVRGREGDDPCGDRAVVEIRLSRTVDGYGQPVIPWLDACEACASWLEQTNPHLLSRREALRGPA